MEGWWRILTIKVLHWFFDYPSICFDLLLVFIVHTKGKYGRVRRVEGYFSKPSIFINVSPIPFLFFLGRVEGYIKGYVFKFAYSSWFLNLAISQVSNIENFSPLKIYLSHRTNKKASMKLAFLLEEISWLNHMLLIFIRNSFECLVCIMLNIGCSIRYRAGVMSAFQFSKSYL